MRREGNEKAKRMHAFLFVALLCHLNVVPTILSATPNERAAPAMQKAMLGGVPEHDAASGFGLSVSAHDAMTRPVLRT